MSSNHHTDQVFKEKRIPKGEIKFQIALNEEQKAAKRIILDNTITVLKGFAGSGKSLLAAQVGLDLLFKRQVEKIIITRPTVEASSPIGFLPGSKEDKLAPFTAPVYDNMHRLYSKEKIDSLVAEGKIEVLPVGFIRGRNFTNSCIIVDECQNLLDRELELIMTRMCIGSKMILCGDSHQIDLRNKKESGFEFVCRHASGIQGFAIVTLKTNHRHPIVEAVLNMYEAFRD